MNFNKCHVSRNLLCANTTETKMQGYNTFTTTKGSSEFILSRNPTVSDTSFTITTSIVLPAGTYTASVYGLTNRHLRSLDRIALKDSNGNYFQNNIMEDEPKTFTLTEETTIASILGVCAAEAEYDNQKVRFMINSGSEALPYEPYSSEVWYDIPHYIHKTDTDTITTLPADIYPNDTTATVGLKGNMSQTGTPTSDSPVIPQGTGERTGNLAQWEKGGISITTGANEAYRTKEQGGTCEQLRTQYISCIGDSNYVLSVNKYPVQSFISFYDENKNYLTRTSGNQQGGTRTFKTDINAKYMRAQIAHITQDQVYPAIEENVQFAITLGSTALPYEPNGYKIPISSANATTPVYLGEVASTRRVKKLVFTGEESFTQTSDYQQSARFRFKANDARRGEGTYSIDTIISSHYVSATGFASGTIVQSNGTDINLTFNMQSSTYPDLTTFKNWLAQQYAAGTPITVWYVLATEETGIVNEPLMKIGEYADEVANISIPVTSGGDTLSVDTTLQPSEVTATYKGWHPVLSVHERNNGQWD